MFASAHTTALSRGAETVGVADPQPVRTKGSPTALHEWPPSIER